MEVVFRSIESTDWEFVAKIYRQGIETNNATFQQDIPTWSEWDEGHLKKCRILVEKDGDIIGWAALTSVSSRCVYAGVAEVSIYVAAEYRNQHMGKYLLMELISQSEIENIWTLQSGIFPENIASLKIHEKLDFRQVGYRERIGKIHGQWRDTLLLERRSKKNGLD